MHKRLNILYTMNTIDWLCNKAPGFSDLSPEERDAIMHFSLLWSLFEAEALHTHASANRILALTHEWATTSHLTIEPFSGSLDYFRGRYFENGEQTHHFNGLNLRRNDSPELVSAVLKNQNNDTADSVAALLIVVYRLRNNLFHGVKWSYGISGQLDNFTNASSALMSALEVHGYQ